MTDPHSTYANLSDEERAGLDARPCARYFGSDGTLCSTHNGRFEGEWAAHCDRKGEGRAGLDARGTITTRAGAELLAFWQMHRYLAHSVKMDEPDALADDIAKVERQAIAAYKVWLAEAVRALHNDWLGARWNEAIDACAALLEDKAEPK